MFCNLFCVLHFACLVCCDGFARVATISLVLLPLLAFIFVFRFVLNCAELLLFFILFFSALLGFLQFVFFYILFVWFVAAVLPVQPHFALFLLLSLATLLGTCVVGGLNRILFVFLKSCTILS